MLTPARRSESQNAKAASPILAAAAGAAALAAVASTPASAAASRYPVCDTIHADGRAYEWNLKVLEQQSYDRGETAGEIKALVIGLIAGGISVVVGGIREGVRRGVEDARRGRF